MEFLTTLLSHQVANIIFMILFVGGLGLAIISVVFGSLTDAVGGALDGLDGHLDFGGDGFGWISFTTICIGISGTGAGGFLFNSLGIPPILVLLIGLAVGFLCAYLAGRFIIIPIKRRQYSGAFDLEQAVGKTATVTAPMSNGGMGEVLLAGRTLTAKPVSKDLTLATGDLVKIVRMEATIAHIDLESGEESVKASTEQGVVEGAEQNAEENTTDTDVEEPEAKEK